ncbi:MAG: sterol desaturase family protein [Oculatellaceae cyanobacterium bins.114]|nr:sterol desaturase family protein [Oculatellaceae cyanobacterium bins.114]
MEARFIRTLVLFFILTVVFGILEYFWPSIPNQPRLRRGLGTDILYWFVTPMVSQILAVIAASIVLLPLYALLGRSLELNSILAGYGPVARLPLWVQGLIVILIGDFIGYWTHRVNHRFTPLWNFHAVHHSAEIIDWLTAVRIHPINDIFSKGLKIIPILLMGFSPIAAELYSPILFSYIALIHANVPWSYGPFRYVISSPAFHRWHHEMDKKAWGKNYAGLFPIYDLIFGTFYLPRGEQPKEFGIYGETMTDNFIGQMLYPFRHWKFLRKAKDSLTNS